MQVLSIEPFVPSGRDFDGAKQFFQALGFHMNWDAGDYVGFERDGCKFILQKYDNVAFAENLMLSVRITNVDEFWRDVTDKQLSQTFTVRVGRPTDQPYGREVIIIDPAGVCWHFIE